MNTLANLLTSLIVAAWVGMVAIFSIQNIQPISIQFLFFESIRLPIGVLLAFSVGVGVLVGATFPLFWHRRKSYRRRSQDDFDLA